MDSEQVYPLHITKSTPKSSPTKNMTGGVPRPLAEISPAERRRNSPSWFQTSPKKQGLSNDSSPFQSSPAESVPSNRLFWQSRNAENIPHAANPTSPSSQRRPSIERLQRASRVKNSNILALEQKQEYDPTRLPQIERPLSKVFSNNFSFSSSGGLRSADSSYQLPDFKRSDSSKSGFPTMSPTKLESEPKFAHNEPRTPSRDLPSPAKSSLSPTKFKDSFDPETGTWSAHTSFNEEDFIAGRSTRHVKSVTFDAAPPQINEYEMATPDLSSVGTNSREGSYESADDDCEDGPFDLRRHDHHEDSFDASLEDTDKTPVVGPDDWRADSPAAYLANNSAKFESSPMPETSPSMALPGTNIDGRQGSVTPSGDHRPLPPVPVSKQSRTHSDSTLRASPGLQGIADRMLQSPHRSLPTPPPASPIKAEVDTFGNGKMSLEDRLKLMMMSDDNNGKTAAEQQRERRLRRANGRDRSGSPQVKSHASENEHDEEEDTLGDISVLGDYQMPTRISRESILRRVNGNKSSERQSDYNLSSPAGSPSPQRLSTKGLQRHIPLDPDVPIPSTEDSILEDVSERDEESVIITRIEDEYQDDVFEVYHDMEASNGDLALHETHGTIQETQRVLVTQVASIASVEPEVQSFAESSLANTATNLPELMPMERPLSNGLESYMLSPANKRESVSVAPNTNTSNTPPVLERPVTPPSKRLSKPEYDGTGWGESDGELDEEPGTPDSVIHHPVEDEDDFELRESPAIPEQIATIKASGSKLKTRVSNTPADIAAMREVRRHVSTEVPIVPPIPEKHRNRMSRDGSAIRDLAHDEYLERHPSFKDRSLTLDLEMGLSMEKDFERVIEGQKVGIHNPTTQQTPSSSTQEHMQCPVLQFKNEKANTTGHLQRGYLMRQNTKLVAASDKDADEALKARSVNNSPVKNDRPQSWVIEPWNGQLRPRSTRSRHETSAAVPALPGRESNTTLPTQATDEELLSETGNPDGTERGRLFVKVMGVKELDLPLPKNERTFFSLTLDNGVHCVTTSWLELARNAPIGQEFELVVPNDLEFQLTLNVKLEKPAYIGSLNAAGKSTKAKASTFSKVFASPKKRKEIELREREDERLAQQHKQALARQRNGTPSGYELLSPIVAEDGSFARSYVCLKEHEQRCYGRPYMAEVTCFNEWASEEEHFAHSVKSKRGDATVIRRAPYKIGKLELQLLFVPRPKNVTDDDMPKSMNSCIRELKAAEERLSRSYEGHLSQQGGDCPYWRRRYFKLVGARLTAYHEATRQPRATINLGNAKRLIDDRQALTEKETLGRGGKRRRSAFAEEEEGYMFVEEGFRIRFNNGEVIDFYADTAEDKDGWMKVLSDIIGRDSTADDDNNSARVRAKWCDLVLKREDQLRKRAETRRLHSRTKSSLI